jgi:hypothetical protein
MHYQWAEVAPAAPALVEALPPLLILCGLIIALGATVLIDAMVRAIFGTVAGILSLVPLVGDITAGVIHDAERAISHALGAGIATIEGAVGHQFHNLARICVHWFHVMENTALVAWEEAKFLTGLPTLRELGHITRELVNKIAHAEAVAQADLKAAVRKLEAEIPALPRHLAQRLTALEHAIADTIPREIKNARDLAKEAERGVAQLWDWTRNLANNPAITAAVATAIAALGLVGIDLLKCDESKSLYNKRGCGLWNGLEDLLGLFIDALVLTDLCEIIPETVKFFGLVEGALTGLIVQASNAVCAASNKNWTTVNVAPGPRPPAQAFDPGSLASGG